jgi:hypothetical protein
MNSVLEAFTDIYQVPLDYLNPNGSHSSILLVRCPATSTPYKGMILFNPGGPGSNRGKFELPVSMFLKLSSVTMLTR